MEVDTINFKLTDFLQPRHKFPADWVSRLRWATPEPLYVLCSRVCDYLPEEPCFQWTNMQVLQWIEALGFPQYRNTFYVNLINGRTLLLLDAAALCAMNIKDFDHITTITAAIRKLYKIELILFKRSISLPPRYPDTHFKYFRVCTGPGYQRSTRTQLWQRMGLVQPPPPQRSHWRKLHEWLQHDPQPQAHRIGYAPRHQLYKVRRDLRPPRSPVSSELEYKGVPCDCIPPCECGWKPWYYREPFTLSCLLSPEELATIEADIRDGDVVVATVSPPAGRKSRGESGQKSCTCIFRHECHWRQTCSAPQVLTILRTFEDAINDEDFVPADLGGDADVMLRCVV